VTFNGNSFDLPVLRYRAIINKVAAPGFRGRLNDAAFEASEWNLTEFINARAASKHHLTIETKVELVVALASG